VLGGHPKKLLNPLHKPIAFTAAGAYASYGHRSVDFVVRQGPARRFTVHPEVPLA